MSFMFNPYPYDDPNVVNSPTLTDETTDSIISGTDEVADHLSQKLLEGVKNESNKNFVVAFEGYIGAQFERTTNLVSRNLELEGVEVETIDFSFFFKPGEQLDKELADYLPEDKEKDPVLLFGKLFEGDYEDLLDEEKLSGFEDHLKEIKKNNSGKVFLIHGYGCTIERLRSYYDLVCYFDLAPKEVILRSKKGLWANLGDEEPKPNKSLLRRCYYVDFEVAGHLRWDLLKEDAIDFYVDSNIPDDLKLIPRRSFNSIFSSLVKYPMRCKPVYMEGVWGGHYIKRFRNLPDSMRNCAWVFELIPLEVSIVVEAGEQLLEFPFFTFVQKKGKELMGKECVEKFDGYFPIRFNYDDSYHSSGNMSIQVHSGHDYNIENYNEHGRQDESYYVVATGHDAKTYIGFNDYIDPDEFIEKAKESDKKNTPIDYQKYVSHVKSQPGVQVMLPAGTIHSSGRNQVVLEIGSLTVGSYTYKMYDYLRKDLTGNPRPIHTYHGENVLRKERTTSWVKENLVQEPQLVRSGEDGKEYIVGEHDLLYFSLRRLEFEKRIEDNTNGIFHVLTLVDGEQVLIQSKENPELSYTQKFLDVVVVPATMGEYVIKNLGEQPVTVHKTMLKDRFAEDVVPGN